MEETEAPSSHFAVFSVLSQVLEKDEISATEFEEKDRPKDDYIDHELLREWFRKRLRVSDDHKMSLREIWRNFCYEYQIYCSLPLFGNVVLRHVLQANSKWKAVTKVGDIKQKRYNLGWSADPPGTEEQIDSFFARIKEKVDRAPRINPMSGQAGSASAPLENHHISPVNSSSISGPVLSHSHNTSPPSANLSSQSGLSGMSSMLTPTRAAAPSMFELATSPPQPAGVNISGSGSGSDRLLLLLFAIFVGRARGERCWLCRSVVGTVGAACQKEKKRKKNRAE